MHIVRDNETRTFTDDTGDTLLLRSALRQREIDECEQFAQREAFAELGKLKAAGVDTDAIMERADSESTKAATEDASKPSPGVRELRVKMLALRLTVGGETLGGEAVVKAYRDMDPPSVAWVDSCVEEVWSAAVPSEADTRGPCADAPVSQGVGATG